jgi:hypothetical protein
MRHHGTRFELVGMQPHDHIGWVFSGPDQFAALAGRPVRDGGGGEHLGTAEARHLYGPGPRNL